MAQFERKGRRISVTLDDTAVSVGRDSEPPQMQQFKSKGSAKRAFDTTVAELLNDGWSFVEAAAAAKKKKKRLVSVRRFEGEHFSGRTEFIEVILDGKTVRQAHGLTGKEEDAQTADATHPSEEEARDAFERMVLLYGKKATLVKSEEREPPPKAAKAVHASHPEFEATLLADPDDAKTAAVYADFLQSRGDLRGQLASLVVAGQPWQPFVSANAGALLGRAVPLGKKLPRLGPTWTHGFLTGVQLECDDEFNLPALTKFILAAPMSRFVTSLRFGLDGPGDSNDWGPTLKEVCNWQRAAQVRALRFDAYTDAQSQISWTLFGDLSRVWTLPSLELLHVRSGGGGTLGDIDAPSLRTFIRESGGLSQDELEGIVQAKWPRLEQLELWLGSRDYGAEADVSLLRPLLFDQAPPRLTQLGLVNNEIIDALLPVLATSPLVKRLKVLDLSKSTLRSPDTLLALRAAFAHLERLDLTENLLDDDAARRIRRALPCADTSKQREFEGEDDDDRYCAVGE